MFRIYILYGVMLSLVVRFTIILAIFSCIALIIHSYASSIGINDVGSTGQGASYTYTTTSYKGYFIFYGGSFYSGEPINYNVASVQLNTVLTNGIYYYFVQNVLVLIANGNGTYTLNFVDNIWNLTYPYSIMPSLIIGNGEVSKAPNQSICFYFYIFSDNITLTPPFNVTLISNVSLEGQYIKLTFSAILGKGNFSTSYNYDTVKILNPSSKVFFVVGSKINTYPSNSDAEFVIGGGGSGSTLYVYNWSSEMMLLYLYDGNYYEVPSAVSYSSITGESVSNTHGIFEYYSSNGYVAQIAGYSFDGQLWNTSANLTVINSSILQFNLVPEYGEWFYEVNGKTFPLTSDRISLPYGMYNITVVLKAGNEIIYEKEFEDVKITPYAVVESKAPLIYVNGKAYFNNTIVNGYYTFYIPLRGTTVVQFPEYYYYQNSSRLEFLWAVYNGKVINSNIINITSPGVYRGVYQLELLLKLPFNLTVIYNGTIYNNVSQLYLPYGAKIIIPEQNVSLNNGTLIEFLNQSLVVYGEKINLITRLFYYVNITYNTYISSLPKSGFYTEGYCISIPKELENETTIVLINASAYKLKVFSPLKLSVNITVYYRIVLMLGNYSVSEFYKEGSVITFNNNISYNGSVMFVAERPITVVINSPKIVSLNGYYELYFLIEVHYLNQTLELWYPSGKVLELHNITKENISYVFSKVVVTHPGEYYLNYTVYDEVVDILPNSTLVFYVKNDTYAWIPVYFGGTIINESILVTSPLVINNQLQQQAIVTPEAQSKPPLGLMLLIPLIIAFLVTVWLMKRNK